MVHDRQPVADLLGFLEVVRGVEDGASRRSLRLDDVEDPQARLRIDPDGRFIEQLGIYDPSKNPGLFRVDQVRLEHWLKVGAQPSETVHRLILKNKTAQP